MTWASGIQLGPYKILAPLRKGGMGEVYRARDKRLDREDFKQIHLRLLLECRPRRMGILAL